MEFFNSAIEVLQTLVVALGCRFWAFGVRSTCWKVMATITPAVMLMYGREAQSKQG